MKAIWIIFLFFYLAQGFGQQDFSKIDKIALKAPETYDLGELFNYFDQRTDGDINHIRAFYVWIAENIEYAVEDMYKVEYYKTTEELINKVLKSRRSVCHGYAELMNQLNKRAGIPSFVVSGYVKQMGKVMNIPHSWVVAKINDKWYVFDPTWGAGYVEKNNFVKRFSAEYFLIDPETSIHTRMPYDPMWQLMDFPISHQDFYKDKPTSIKKYFNYRDSINDYSVASEVEQLDESCRRIKQWGFKNQLISEYYHFNLKQLEIERANEIILICNQAVDQYNEAINSYNSYVRAKNKRFAELSDSEVLQLIREPERQLQNAQSILLTAKTDNKIITGQISKQKEQMGDLQKQITEEKKFVEKYCSTKKNSRQFLFYNQK